MLTLAPALEKSREVVADLWRKPWVRKLSALVLSGLIAASCERWPAWSQLLCSRLAPFLETLLSGGLL